MTALEDGEQVLSFADGSSLTMQKGLSVEGHRSSVLSDGRAGTDSLWNWELEAGVLKNEVTVSVRICLAGGI